MIRMQLRYSFRVYPSAGQRMALARAFGCARVVYNDALRARETARSEGMPFPKTGDLSKTLITGAKNTPERAWLGEVSAVDREMPDSEFRLIGQLSAQLPAFAGFDRNKLVETAQECAVILNTKDGLDRLLTLVANALSHPLRETAYLVACEMAAHDRHVPLTEVALLEKIRRALHIDRLTAAALERGGTPPASVKTEAACTIEKVGEGFKITTMKLVVRASVPGLDAEAFKKAAEATKEGCPVSTALKGNVDLQLDAALI